MHFPLTIMVLIIDIQFPGHNVGLYDLTGNLIAHFAILKHVLIFIN